MIKIEIMKIAIKLNQKIKELRVTYLKKFQYLLTFSLFFSFSSITNVSVFIFQIEIKMRCAYVGGKERKRECREFFFFFLPPSIC